ncbi:hypothetical protein MKC55_21065 [[Clostridium] innocuum]|nr:hypothetical protein [[Clostridium] innocuum]
MREKERYYARIAAQTINGLTKSEENWTAFLSTISRNYDFSYPELVMIHAQRPNATLCMDFDAWREQTLRFVKRGAKGIALFVTDGEIPYLRYVFDVADTGERTKAKPLDKLWKWNDNYRIPIQDMVKNKFAIHQEGTWEEQLHLAVKECTQTYWSNNRNNITEILAENQSKEYDGSTLEKAFQNAVEESSHYVVSLRTSEQMKPSFDKKNFENISIFRERKSINALGTAVNIVTTEILQEIEKTILAFEHHKEKEGSKEYDDIQTSRGLLDTKYPITAEYNETSREVRKDEKRISQEEQSDDIQRYDSYGNLVSSSFGSGQNRQSENGIIDETTSREDSDTEPKEISEAVGTTYEDADRGSRENNFEGNNQQLTLDFFLSEEEQIDWIDKVESEKNNETLFTLSFPQEDIDIFLIHGSNNRHARMMIVNEYAKGKSTTEIADALKKIYQGGYGVNIGKTKIAAWYGEDGIHLSKGTSARYEPYAKIISWQEAANRIEELLEEGKFATDKELAEAESLERNIISEKMWYLYHDLSEDGKELHLFSCLKEMEHDNYSNKISELSKRLKEPFFCETLKKQYAEFKTIYVQYREILRFHYHKIDELEKAIDELSWSRKELPMQKESLLEVKSFITDDEINYDLTRGSGFSSGKERIYEYFIKNHSTQEKIEFLKKEFGIGGKSPALLGTVHSSQNHDAKGISYTKINCEEILLSWTQVANRYKEMIQKERYYTTQELEKRMHQDENKNAETSSKQDSYEGIEEDLDELEMEM